MVHNACPRRRGDYLDSLRPEANPGSGPVRRPGRKSQAIPEEAAHYLEQPSQQGLASSLVLPLLVDLAPDNSCLR